MCELGDMKLFINSRLMHITFFAKMHIHYSNTLRSSFSNPIFLCSMCQLAGIFK